MNRAFKNIASETPQQQYYLMSSKYTDYSLECIHDGQTPQEAMINLCYMIQGIIEARINPESNSITALWLFSNEAEDSTSRRSARRSSINALKKPTLEESIGLTSLLASSERSSAKDHSPTVPCG